MIPIKDENPTRNRAVLTLLLIVACVAVYFLLQPSGQGAIVQQTDDMNREQAELEFLVENAAIPCEVTKGRPLTVDELRDTFTAGDESACQDAPTSREYDPDKNVYLALLYSMFMHGSLLHIAGNMLFLWVFGNNIEDRMGKPWYLAFYLAGGLAASLAHVYVQPDSTVPVVGASGAIAAVMGAYLVLFPDAPIRTVIIFYFILFRDISAKWLLGFWFLSQFFLSPNSGVAWMAHVGGFVFGAIVALLFRRRLVPPRHEAAWGY